MLVKYSSNNSGGVWWLKDKDWKRLEEEGWKVEWFRDEGEGLTKPDKEGRWLGALATHAEKEFLTIKEALEEFERLTGQDVSEEGCGCCGAPHGFSSEEGYWSGRGCLEVLYGEGVPRTLREAAERLR